MKPEALTPAELDWTEAGAPVSRVFGDVYFSREDGLAETRAVFLAGCGLPDAWAARRHFTVAELGFGTGLNILALLDLWRRARPDGGRLHIWSVEAHPLSLQAAAAAHAAWPELAELSQALLAVWPQPTPGLHRLSLPELDAVIDLWLGDAAEGLRQWRGRADAWFLDGFAPSTNPAMWSQEIMTLVADRSAAGARLATFTVAGHVRRSLAAAGFSVEKRPGHGRKRERLEAMFAGVAADPRPPGQVAVIGAGVAGACVIRALGRLGVRATLIEAVGFGAGASGAPAALVTPWVDAGLSPAAVLAAQAFQRAVRVYEQEAPEAVMARGVVRLPREDAEIERLLAVAEQPIWPAGAMTELNAAKVAELSGEAETRSGVWLDQALVIEPRTVLEAWLSDAALSPRRAVAVVAGERPKVTFEDGSSETFDHVVVTAGWGAGDLGVEGLSPVRGQLVWARGIEANVPMIWGPGYAVPTRDGVLVGATHDRGRSDTGVSDDDSAVLLERLDAARPALAQAMRARPLEGRAAVRATTRDHRPLCGRLGQGVWGICGLGGRGFSWGPLLGEHIAAEICGTPSPIAAAATPLIDPQRAARRP